MDLLPLQQRGARADSKNAVKKPEEQNKPYKEKAPSMPFKQGEMETLVHSLDQPKIPPKNSIASFRDTTKASISACVL